MSLGWLKELNTFTTKKVEQPQSKSREWLLSLKIGDVIHAIKDGHDERLIVVSDYNSYNKKSKKISVRVKRPHLKQMLYLTEDGDFVGYQWSARRGKEQNNFLSWVVVRSNGG